MSARLTDDQRTAALLVLFFAALTFEERRPDVWWYAWCVEHSNRARDPLLASVWWAMRMLDKGDDESDAEQWLSYVEYVYSYRRRS